MVLAGACSNGGVNLGGGQGEDPGAVDFPIAYVKRTIPVGQDDPRQQRDAVPDADLFMRNRASPSSAEIDITGRITGDDLYDIKDVDVSQDGSRIVFAMRGPLDEDQDEIDPPSWDIWEYEIATDTLRRVIASNTTNGEGHDIGPQYLPDGRILFTSTRQRQSQAILRDEGKPGFELQALGINESAFLLHVMNADGTDIQQITFHQSHDLWPAVLQDGRVVFTRLDSGPGGRGMHLYTANPDGTDLQLLYGARSHNTGPPGTPIQFTRPREMEDGRILTLVRPFYDTDTDFGGDLVLINAAAFVEHNQPLAALPPGASPSIPAQSRATPNQVSLVEGPSVGGRFRSAFPLWDHTNRLLVSWSLCRLRDNSQAPAAIVPCTPERLNDPTFETRYETAPPLYSAFIFNPADNTFKPLFQPEEGVMITDLVAAHPRARQVHIPDRATASNNFDPALVSEGLGVLEIRNVYDFDGNLANTNQGLTGVPEAPDTATIAGRPAAQRPARFLRIEKAVSLGDDQLGFPAIANQAFGVGNFMREIIGYAPIEPDGSVSVQVPSNVAFVISVLDGNGRRLFPQHRVWLQVRPGEIRRCNGCHEPSGGQDRSHGRDGTSFVAGGPWGAMLSPSAAPFPNTQPITAANAVSGDTMAQARARTSCATSPATCSQKPGVNVIFEDVWTDPATAGRDPDEPFAWTYGAGLSTPAPVRPGCISSWTSTCRIIINYPQHIQPIWTVDRVVDGVDRRCTNCHAPQDENGVVQAPAGQLDLSGDPSEEQLHVVSYREFFFADTVEDLIGGSLVPRTRTVTVGTDPDTGEPIIEDVPVTATRPLTPGNARGQRFFACFERDDACSTGDPDGAGGTVNHNGFLTPSELRLISEWVDIGAQYFNNPFDPDVPLN